MDKIAPLGPVPDKAIHVNLETTMDSLNLAPLGPVPEEAIHVDLETTKDALQSYARANGYSIAVASSKPARVIYICSKGGKYRDKKDKDMHESKRRKNTSTTKTGCPFRVDAMSCKTQPGWKVDVV